MVGWSIRPYPAQEVEQPALTLCSYSPATVPWTDVLLSCRDKRMGRGDDREEVGESEVIALLITQFRLSFSTISVLVPYTPLNNSFFLFLMGGQEREADIWRGLHCYTHSDLLFFPVQYSNIPRGSIRS